MDIRFVSSLTAEDENRFAPALLKAIAALLDPMPIAYTVRVETTGSQVFQHTHPAPQEISVGVFDSLSGPGAVRHFNSEARRT
jgi:hypothetical protein